MELAITPVEPEDFRALHGLCTARGVAETLGHTPAETVESFRKRLAEADPDASHVIKATAGEELLGVAGLVIHRPLRRRHVGRLWIAVAPDARRRGVATRLMQALIETADMYLGLARLELTTHVENRAAIALYEKLGFAIEATSRCGDLARDGGPGDAHVMARLRPGLDPAPTAPRPEEAPQRRTPPAPVRIRAQSLDDAPALARLHRDPAVARQLLQLPTSPASRWRRLLESNVAGDHHVLLAEIDGELAGAAGLHGHGHPRLRHMVEMGMAVATRFQGMGVGSALMDALLELGDRYLGLRRIELTVYPDNERAIRLYRKAGFVDEGRLRAWAFRDGSLQDVLLMGRVR